MSFKKRIENYNLFTNYKVNILKDNKSYNFIFGNIYEISNSKNINIKKNYDGRFCYLSIYKNKIKIELDQFSRIDIFYFQEKNNFYISSNFKLLVKIIKSKTLNQLASGHSLNVIGIRPAKQTLFNEISRIGVNEELIIIKNKIHVNRKKLILTQTKKYGDSKINEYFKINQEYLRKLGKTSKKNIYMSSGFDSSYLAANQKKIYGSKNILGHTVVQKLSRRSKIYNIFELKRILKLKKHFNFKVKLTEVNLIKNFEKYSEEISEISGKRMMANTLAAFMHYKLAKSSSNSGFSNETYAGEVSDGVHNFGFSIFLFD